MNPRLAILVCLSSLLGGCGQTGKLYLPEPAGEVVTRPAPAPDTPTEDEKKDKKDEKKN